MKKLLLILTMLLIPTWAMAGSVKIQPDGVVAGSDSWSTNDPVSKVNAVTDGVEAEYIFSSGSFVQRFTYSNTAGIPSNATIDSFVVWNRAQVSNDAGTDRIRNRIMMDGVTNFCDGVNIDLTNAWVNYREKFTFTPTTAGTCTSTLSIARMDSLNVQLLDVIGDENRVTQCSIIVWYTEAGGAPQKSHRREMILLSIIENKNRYDEFALVSEINADPIIGFKKSHWFWKEEVI